MHFIKVAHYGKLYTAAKRLDEVTCQTRAAATQAVDDAYAGLDTRSNALPLQRMIQERIAIVQSDIERSLGLTMLTSKEIMRCGFEIHRPEEACPLGLQLQDAVIRIGSKLGQGREIRG